MAPITNGLLGKPAVFRIANRNSKRWRQIWPEIGLTAGFACQACKQRFLPDETS
jgi:hypothetical protein